MKVIMYPAMTLDGFIADVNGKCYDWISDKDEQSYMNLIHDAGCSLVGKKTFEQYRGDYPHANGAMTFVYTSDKSCRDEEGIAYLTGTPEEVLKAISDSGFSEVVLSGGGQLNGSFAEAGLVDEIIVSLYPLTLGGGIRLFGKYTPRLNLKLLSTTNEIDGIVKNHYQVIK